MGRGRVIVPAGTFDTIRVEFSGAHDDTNNMVFALAPPVVTAPQLLACRQGDMI